MPKLTIEEHFWGRYDSDPTVDWASQDSAADTADEVELVANGVYAVQCTEDGHFRAGATGQTAADLRAHGRFVRAGDVRIFWMTDATKLFLAYVAKDSVAAKWQYVLLDKRSATL